MKIAIIAEKPSVAREIAAIVGASHKEDGFLSGNNYMVTWALGHLVQPAMPEDYGFTGFVKENLPIIPETFILKPRQIREGKEYKPDSGALRQLKIIKHVFDSCDRIIVATDAGREGELIFRYIYSHLNCKKTFDRLWISSLTDKAIKDGLQNLKAGSCYDNLYFAAKARSEADWLVGINASQALSIAAGRGVFSLGRVQTPTLAMICKRYLENKSFVSVPFWQHKINLEKEGIPFSIISEEKYTESANDTYMECERIFQGGTVRLVSIEKKTIHQAPPLLYDLTTLQKEANSKYGFSADKTLSIAQKLYESKLITYPRTGSRYIPKDVFDDIPLLIEVLKQHEEFEPYIQYMDCKVLNINSVDDKKVTDHHALIITENFPKQLSGDEQTIYDMIAGRMLEAFSPVCTKEQSKYNFDAREHPFSMNNSKYIKMGWRGVFAFDHLELNEEEGFEKYLPELSEGEELEIQTIEVLDKQTKPKPLHTEASLLTAMESAGKEVENEAEREAMKESGIGTPATRAAIIETLFERDYIRREKKSLVPTAKGLSVYETVKDKQIADPEMTGNWENALLQIERGEMPAETFQRAIEIYTKQITKELINTKLEVTDNNAPICPKCKTAKISFFTKVVKCTNENCGWIVFRSKSENELTDKQITELITKGQTGIIKGFKSKAGKLFDAGLKFDEDYRVVFDFEKKGKRK